VLVGTAVGWTSFLVHLWQGQASIGDWAEQLQLPIALTQAAVSKRLGSIIRADQRGGMLYTPSFMQREAARARGAFSAATKSVPLSVSLETRFCPDCPAVVLGR
jgi:hypothetical protein